MLKCKSFSIACLLQFWLPLVLLLPLSAQAYTGVTIVMSHASDVNDAFVQQFKAVLSTDKTHPMQVTVINLSEVEELTVAENSELVVALGVKALQASSKLKQTTPVLGIFVPLPTFNGLMRASGRRLGNFSAIVLDQPFRRQIGLAKIVLPAAKNMAILLGGASNRYKSYLQGAAEQYGFNVDIRELTATSDLISALESVFNTNDVLLTIPDPAIYNRETAQPILLTSYHHQVPVIGYSKSYVKAGALAAVFSDADQLAKQAAEMAIADREQSTHLSPPVVPKYFSVIINRQVQRSLDLSIADEDTIYQQLMLLETSAPEEAAH